MTTPYQLFHILDILLGVPKFGYDTINDIVSEHETQTLFIPSVTKQS
jgi:hypothetical protein